jgi:UDP-glucose 4-epimerase
VRIGELKTLVTGVDGLLGTHLRVAMAHSGGEIVGLDIRRDGVRRPLPATLRVDVSSPGLLSEVPSLEVSAVVHLAARHFIPDCEKDPAGTFRVNVTGTAGVLSLARREHADCVVLASTADVYESSHDPVGEDAIPGPASVYGRSKLEAEHLVRSWHAERPDRCAYLLRIFNMVGAGDRVAHLVPYLVGRFMAGQPRVEVGNLGGVRDFVWAADVASLVTRLPVAPGVHVINVGTGVGHAGYDIVDTLADLTGWRGEVVRVSERVRPGDRPVLVSDARRLRTLFPDFPSRPLATILASALPARVDAQRPSEWL